MPGNGVFPIVKDVLEDRQQETPSKLCASTETEPPSSTLDNSVGELAWRSHITPYLDGSCPIYAPAGLCTPTPG